ncbi:hypothetical protein GCM10011507_17830 [Edaphobacter acidisoli]|uniref:Rv2525c-like glycoside hydrolase-like domain-containing protein n=1 Tax=Edaphobacter acidisoli TaxID=2040573 RepID=A0A916RRE0_9BACT|nr:glycoside hydrolase domain-containing protein [Edaphobacter acidisoli]GGA66742.1 hypothetical protein GCM10011507_17830 [Edaphobacter acidisoli]
MVSRKHLLAASLILLTLATFARAQQSSTARKSYIGFDLNLYPGDNDLPALRKHFAFAGYWLNTPPGEDTNTWLGKRDALIRNGFGFLVLFNGRVDAELMKAQRAHTSPESLGQKDAAAAIAAAQREHFPAHTIIFLDQEEGGRLLDEQAAYLFAWTEAVAHSGYLPGVYASGQPVSEGHGHTITTVQDIREQVAAKHLHPIAIFVYQDACPPSNGCTLNPPSIAKSGTPDALVWQYAQSPRRKSITRACAKTYSSDGNCYAPNTPKLLLDMSVSDSPNPSHGR